MRKSSPGTPSPGDAVTEDQLIVEVMTDKAAVEVPAPVSGRVVSITGAPGDKVAVGSPLIVFDVGEGAATNGGAAAVAGGRSQPRRNRALATAPGRRRRHRPQRAPAPASAQPCRVAHGRRGAAARAKAGHGVARESAPGARGGHRFDHGGGVGSRRTDSARRSGGGGAAVRAASHGRCPRGRFRGNVGNQSDRLAPPDRRTHERGQAHYSAFRLRRGSRCHRTRVAAACI